MKKRFTEEQIIRAIQRHEAGEMAKDICRELGISNATFSNWKAKYSGLEVSEARRLRELEAENAKLKRIVADQALDIVALKDINSRKW